MLLAILAPCAQAALKYEPSNYAARGNLLLQLDGIRNVGLLKAHDGDASQWIDLAAGNSVSFGNKTGSGVVSEWADDGYVFGGGEIGRLADTITLGNELTIQIVCDINKSEQQATYPFFFDVSGGGDKCCLYMYKLADNNQLIFRDEIIGPGGGKDVSIQGWTGRKKYITRFTAKARRQFLKPKPVLSTPAT